MSLPRFNRRQFFEIQKIDGKPRLDFLSFRWINFAEELRNKSVGSHVVEQHEVGRMWLISRRYYERDTLDWILVLVNGIIDPVKDMEVGQELVIPSLSQIESFYQRVRAADRSRGVAKLPRNRA